MHKNLKSWIKKYHIFLDDKTSRNVWINVGESIQVYVRKGRHGIDGMILSTIDIANITIGEKYRGKGLGTELIDYVHSHNPFHATFIESILNEDFYLHLKEVGWRDVFLSNPPSVYKKIKQNNTDFTFTVK